jgi:two-component system cell cycle response regulator
MGETEKKILIIDDNQDLREAMRDALLLSFRCNVDEAQNGMEGLARAKQHRPDLILLDSVMPGVDGERFLMRLRQELALFNVPVIVVTARQEKDDVTKFLKLGISDYLVKPILLQTMIERVAKVIGHDCLLSKQKT